MNIPSIPTFYLDLSAIKQNREEMTGRSEKEETWEEQSLSSRSSSSTCSAVSLSSLMLQEKCETKVAARVSSSLPNRWLARPVANEQMKHLPSLSSSLPNRKWTTDPSTLPNFDPSFWKRG